MKLAYAPSLDQLTHDADESSAAQEAPAQQTPLRDNATTASLPRQGLECTQLAMCHGEHHRQCVLHPTKRCPTCRSTDLAIRHAELAEAAIATNPDMAEALVVAANNSNARKELRAIVVVCTDYIHSAMRARPRAIAAVCTDYIHSDDTPEWAPVPQTARYTLRATHQHKAVRMLANTLCIPLSSSVMGVDPTETNVQQRAWRVRAKTWCLGTC